MRASGRRVTGPAGCGAVGQRGATIDIGVLTVVVVLCVALVAWRGAVLARDWGTSRTWAAAMLVVSVVALGAAAVPEGRHQWVQARATALVRHASGVPGSSATCERFTPDLLDLTSYSGFVSSDSQHVARLRRTVCNDLADWLISDKNNPTTNQIRAVHVVVHEAMHVGGQFDEAIAECHAMQLDTDAAMFLGATRAQAQALTQAYYRRTYPLMAPDYVSPSCAPNQAYDLTPGDGQFP